MKDTKNTLKITHYLHLSFINQLHSQSMDAAPFIMPLKKTIHDYYYNYN